MKNKIFITVCLIAYSCLISGQQFSKKQVLSDLVYLKTSLEETHFNLYGHTTKREFEDNFIKVKSEIQKDSFSFLETTNLFQKVVAEVNNAHTRVAFPGSAYRQFAESGGLLFPIEVAIENNKVLVRKNWSNQKNIKIGGELKSINGMPIATVLASIYPLISAESMYFKNTLIEAWSLPRYYWQVFGGKKRFDIEIYQNGKLEQFTLPGIKVLEDYEWKRSEITKLGREFRFFSNVAYLRPGDFSGDFEKYKRFIDSSFTEIKSHKSEDLIIDLRNNGGGNDPFSDYLISYIADQSFRWNSKFEVKTSQILKEFHRKRDTTQKYTQAILKHRNGEIFKYEFGAHAPQPTTKRFKGKVFALVNRHSFSQATVAAGQIQDYEFGTIVGEETAEHPNLLASIFHYHLPITNIQIDVSKGKITRVNGKDDGKGVIPEIMIQDHLLDEKDEILDGLLKMLHESDEK